jgi:1,4-dihydroxy-2-naphthoate octaprenyltransferase
MSQAVKSIPVWVTALRPKTLTAALVPILAGGALAFASGTGSNWFLLLYGLGSALLIQTGTHFINDAYDAKNGADKSDRLGPIRLVQSGILTQQQVYWLGITSFFAALILGMPLMAAGGSVITLLFGLAILFGYCYTGGPFPLAYVGLGDIAVIAFFGIIETAAVAYLLTGAWTLSAVIAGLQIGLLATALLAVNNLRDIESDARANKRTLCVRFGKQFGRAELAFTVLVPYLIGIYWIFESYFFAFAMPILAFPLAVVIVRRIYSEEPSARYNKYLAMAGLHHLLFGILLSLGLLF